MKAVIFGFLLNSLCFFSMFSQTDNQSLKASVVAYNLSFSSNSLDKTAIQNLLKIAPSKDYFMNGTANFVFIVRGYQMIDGKPNLSLSFELLKSNGDVINKMENLATANDTSLLIKNVLFFNQVVSYTFDSTDYYGDYIVKIEVTDNISNNKTIASDVIRLVTIEQAAQILQVPINNAKTLDDLWAYYFVSKDVRAVQRVISILSWIKEGQGFQKVFGLTAQWSLLANSIKYDDVYNICEKEIDNASGDVRSILKDIIKDAKNKKKNQK